MEHQRGKEEAQQESWKNEWHEIKYQGELAKASRSPSARDEESHWVAVEDRRRRRVAFEETARSILRYLEGSEDLKVSVTELQEQLGKTEEAGISIKQVALQARNEKGQQIFEFI